MTLTSLARPSYMPKYKPDASCVLYLEGQQDPLSGTIKDLSGYGNHGTITGATWERLPSGLWVNNFDGADDNIIVANNDSLNATGAFTVMTWWKPETIADWDVILSKGNSADGGASAYRLLLHSTPLVRFSINNADSPWATFTNSVWQFVVGVYDLSNIYIAVNNVWSAGGPYALPILTNANPLGIGKYADGGQFTPQKTWGVRIFKDIAFSATQIAGIFNQERHLFGV
jgi:hypothetical protein